MGLDAFAYSEDGNIDDFIANADESFGSDVCRVEADELPPTVSASAPPPVPDTVARAEEPTQTNDPTSTNASASPITETADIAMAEERQSAVVEPWMLPSRALPPEEIAAKGELVSALLNSEQIDEDETTEEIVAASTTSATKESAASIGGPYSLKPKSLKGLASLCEYWPTVLEERRKFCYLPSPEVAAYYERNRTTSPCILYWMRNTLRVSHGNFALETALMLAERLGLPVVTICLVPRAIVYPTCHSSNVNDAFARWSYVDVYQQLCQIGLPFLGFTGSTAPKKIKSAADVDGGFPLFQLFESFSPYVVITDDACDLQASRDLHQLTQFLHATPSSSSWGLIAIDSNTCLPLYSRSEMVRRTLAAGERFLSEDEFSCAYAECFQQQGESYSLTAIERIKDVADPEGKLKRVTRLKLLRQLEMEEVNWRIIESLNRQCSPEMAPFSEMAALQKLDRLLGEPSDRPAIQAELQVSDYAATFCDGDAEL